jgi:hypothetical protein
MGELRPLYSIALAFGASLSEDLFDDLACKPSAWKRLRLSEFLRIMAHRSPQSSGNFTLIYKVLGSYL